MAAETRVVTVDLLRHVHIQEYLKVEPIRACRLIDYSSLRRVEIKEKSLSFLALGNWQM